MTLGTRQPVRFRFRCLCAVAVAWTLISCTPGGTRDAPQSPPPGGWEGLALEQSEAARTDFGRAVLADGVVSAGEYEESVDVLLACGEERGVAIVAERRFGIYTYSVEGEEGDRVFQECFGEDINAVQAIYNGVYADPDMQGLIPISNCLVDAGLLPADYEFDSDRFGDDLAELTQASAADARQIIAVERCIYDPLGHDAWESGPPSPG